jgi:hypothetical protein
VNELIESVEDAVCPHETGDEPCRNFIIVPHTVDSPTTDWLRSMLGACGDGLNALEDARDWRE